MKILKVKSFNERISADFLIIPFFKSKKEAAVACEEKSLLSEIEEPIKLKDFEGKKEEITYLYSKGNDKRIIMLGLGEIEKVTAETIRQCYSMAVRFSREKKAKSINILLPTKCKVERKDLILAISDSLFLTNYSFDDLKNDTKKDAMPSIVTASIIGLNDKDLEMIDKNKKIADGVNLARDLVNNNADLITPQKLSEVALELGKLSKNVQVTVFDKKRIEKEKMGLLLAVNQGSHRPCTFTIITYKGNPKSKDHTVLVGKGLTYDSGGLCLKSAANMIEMKTDMAGAAAVLGTMHAIISLNLKVNVTGIFPATENAIGPQSFKTGDVYKGYSGKTVEIGNTDAEGRLILADALSYAVKNIKPSRIVDIATLTGAIVVALGEEVAGLFANNDKLADQLLNASKRIGDPLWRMPLYQEYKEFLKSDIADINNMSSGKGAGSITAALFLEEFIEKLPWAHIDIAGSSFLSKPKRYNTTHATGSGVRIFVDFLEHLSE